MCEYEIQQAFSAADTCKAQVDPQSITAPTLCTQKAGEFCSFVFSNSFYFFHLDFFSLQFSLLVSRLGFSLDFAWKCFTFTLVFISFSVQNGYKQLFYLFIFFGEADVLNLNEQRLKLKTFLPYSASVSFHLVFFKIFVKHLFPHLVLV